MRKILLACLLVLSACATAGNHVSEDDIGKLYSGMPAQDVRAVLGSPTSDVPAPDGARHWIYWSSSALAVPFYASVNSKSVTLVIRDGKLEDVPGYTLRPSDK